MNITALTNFFFLEDQLGDGLKIHHPLLGFGVFGGTVKTVPILILMRLNNVTYTPVGFPVAMFSPFFHFILLYLKLRYSNIKLLRNTILYP
jgi:hypothetical protein